MSKTAWRKTGWVDDKAKWRCDSKKDASRGEEGRRVDDSAETEGRNTRGEGERDGKERLESDSGGEGEGEG